MKIQTQRFYEMTIQSPDPRRHDSHQQDRNFHFLIQRLIGQGIPCKVYSSDIGNNCQTFEFCFHEDEKNIVDSIVCEYTQETTP